MNERLSLIPTLSAVAALLFPAVDAAAQSPKRIFVTSVSGTGDLGGWPDAGAASGIAAGDAICRARAAAGNLANPDAFVALLSDSKDDAYCRVHDHPGKKADNCGQAVLPAGAGPWMRMDYFPFSETVDQALSPDGRVYTTVRFDEFGNMVNGAGFFTGTDVSGSLFDETFTCNDWMQGNEGSVIVGASENVDWVERALSSCSGSRRLLCLETGSGTSLPPFERQGRPVFVTSVSGPGDLSQWTDAGAATGLAAGDAICRARAESAGLAQPETFKAWLSDSTTNAIDRLTNDGPWVRPDGVVVAENKADLTDGSVFTAINIDEAGNYLSTSRVSPWTGTTQAGAADDANCNDWTTAVAAESGRAGFMLDATRSWTDLFDENCSSTERLYCFSDASGSPPAEPPVTSVLPGSRSVEVGGAATVFAAFVNPGAETAVDCAIKPAFPLPVDFHFQTTDPATNAPTGMSGALVEIGPGATQSFVVSLTPQAIISPTTVEFLFDCGNSDPAAVVSGVNTLLLSASENPVPDVIALAAAGSGGILSLNSAEGVGAFAVATANVGSSGAIRVMADTGGAALPLSLSLCRTEPATGVCVDPPTEIVETTMDSGETQTFAVFAMAEGEIPFDPANSRVFVRFRDPGELVRGATSVAVRTD